eukprot:783240-Pyramimonas_sp.AAC.2
MASGVLLSCLPRHAPCATIPMSTAGTARPRMRRYGSAMVSRSGVAPRKRRAGTAATCEGDGTLAW